MGGVLSGRGQVIFKLLVVEWVVIFAADRDVEGTQFEFGRRVGFAVLLSFLFVQDILKTQLERDGYR